MKGNRKFVVVMTAIIVSALLSLAQLIVLKDANIVQFVVGQIIAFAGGYVAGNFASMITTKQD